jgi:hypothetical protein
MNVPTGLFVGRERAHLQMLSRVGQQLPGELRSAVSDEN